MGLLLNRRREMGGGEVLPQGAKKIEYLQTSGTQYFTVPTFDFRSNQYTIEIELSSSNYTSTWCPFVVQPVTGGFWYGFNNSNYIYRTFNGSNWIQYRISLNSNKHAFKLVQASTATLYLDGNSVGTYNGNPVSGTTSNMHLLSDGGTHFTCKIYSFKLYYNGILRYDMIPVRINQVGYLYDKITGNFYGNSGSGSFTLGPDV